MENKHGGLPFGFKFKPSNPELIWYLLHKVNGSPLPCFIVDCDLYDGKDRWKQMFEGRPVATPYLYLFTKLKKMTEKGTINRNRRTGGGKWKETQNCGTIYDPKTKKPIGIKRSFKFAPNKDTAAEFTGRWLMDEFSLDSRFAHQNVDDYVVCCIKHERDRKSKNIVQQTRNSEQLIQQNCTNTTNAGSINDTAAATTVDPEVGLADTEDPNLCIDLDKLYALLDDTDQTLAPMMEENCRASDCQFAATPTISGISGFSSLNSSKNTNKSNTDSIDDTTAAPTLDPENGATDNVQMRNSEQVFEVDCRISEGNNYATEGTALDSENDEAEFEDPNMWVELEELLGNLDQTSSENVGGLDCQFGTPTTLGGSGFGCSNSLTNTCSFLMDTLIHNWSSEEKAATSQH